MSILRKSIKTNKLIINITSLEYAKMILLKDKLKEKYQKYLLQVKTEQDYNKIQKHNLLVKEIIKELLNNYPILNKYNVCVFLTGSFARGTNKLNSDLDLHFCYKRKYHKKLFKYEEIIYYIIKEIFELDRTKVHNMISSRIKNKKVDKIINSLDNKPLEIIIKEKHNYTKYIISGNLKKRIYMQYYNNKDLNTLFKYLKKELLNQNKEWVHVFYVFTNQRKFLKYYDKLFRLELKENDISKIEKRKETMKAQITSIENMLKNANKNSIITFKTIFQMEEFKLFNEYISYMRTRYLLNNNDWKFIDLLNNNTYLNEDNIIKEIKSYMIYLFKIVEPLKNKYSIHEDKYISNKYFLKIENKLLKINNLIKEVL